MSFRTLITILVFAVPAFSYQSLPAVEREFRGVWIATVDNIDFPTKKGLSIEDQKMEMIADLELAASLNMNAVVFQVRPMADAIYESKLEPWSEFLTGRMGKPQGFDPLAFLIDEAHKRGILVHAWFNPYRAFHPAAETVSDDHITKRRPDLVRQYGKYKWLDPTDPEVRAYSLGVVTDVVRRYDIDGVHFDDYFYPYPITENGAKIDFPDGDNWRKYLSDAQRLSGPKMRRIPLGRDDWRRWNVNQFIETVGREIKRIKPEILYGISPFGVASENYKNLYADAEKWLADGTVDYFVPQLYWKTDRKTREFPLLLRAWEESNALKRHVWAGLGTYKINDPKENFSASEITGQIQLSREIQTSHGNIQFSLKSIRSDFGGVQKALRDVYNRAAIIPESSWIKSDPPANPRFAIKSDAEFVHVRWTETGPKRAFWFIVYAKDKNGWSYSVVPAAQTTMALSADRKIETVIVRSVDRLGRISR